MLTLVTTAGLEAATFPVAPGAHDIALAQLDIIAAASGGAMHAASGGTVDPFTFRLSISVTNAISSVIVVGALLAVGVALVTNDSGPLWARALGFVALIFASVNIFGGFLVTQRMLGMYQKKKK
jgi:NAD(P) transhydrogenase subunit alpha